MGESLPPSPPFRLAACPPASPPCSASNKRIQQPGPLLSDLRQCVQLGGCLSEFFFCFSVLRTRLESTSCFWIVCCMFACGLSSLLFEQTRFCVSDFCVVGRCLFESMRFVWTPGGLLFFEMKQIISCRSRSINISQLVGNRSEKEGLKTTANAVYRTTNADAGVGIGLKRRGSNKLTKESY